MKKIFYWIIEKIGIIKDMFKHWRRWYLLRRLRSKMLTDSKNFDITNIGVGNKLFVSKQTFLEKVSEKYFWVMKRSQDSKNKRILIDELIISSCVAEQPQRIDERRAGDLGVGEYYRVPPSYLLISLTGYGDHDADFSNAFVDFANKYKIIWFIIIGLIGYSPIFKPLIKAVICKIFSVWC